MEENRTEEWNPTKWGWSGKGEQSALDPNSPTLVAVLAIFGTASPLLNETASVPVTSPSTRKAGMSRCNVQPVVPFFLKQTASPHTPPPRITAPCGVCLDTKSKSRWGIIWGAFDFCGGKMDTLQKCPQSSNFPKVTYFFRTSCQDGHLFCAKNLFQKKIGRFFCFDRWQKRYDIRRQGTRGRGYLDFCVKSLLSGGLLFGGFKSSGGFPLQTLQTQRSRPLRFISTAGGGRWQTSGPGRPSTIIIVKEDVP